MINALRQFKQFLLINEWDNIVNCINHWVEETPATIEKKKNNKYQQEEPVFRALFTWLLETKWNASIFVYLLIFVAGFVIGKWGI